jgi:hypothetical protein
MKEYREVLKLANDYTESWGIDSDEIESIADEYYEIYQYKYDFNNYILCYCEQILDLYLPQYTR